MAYTRTKISLLTFLFLLPLSASAVPQNNTVDDSNQIAINYWTAADWSHDPLAGYEQFFFGGTRSFTYVPGAAALFNFTGTGIYLQGPHSNDQASRSITLDGQNMGIFSAYAPERLPTEGASSVFWGLGGLPHTLHTVVVTHIDTADKILVMDAWIYEADPSQSPQGTNTAAVSSPSTLGSDSDTNAGIIIGISIPVLLLPLYIAGYCLFSRRLERNAKRQRDAMKAKMHSSFRNSMHLSQRLHPRSASATSGLTPSRWLSANGTSAPEHSSSDSNAELIPPPGAVVPRGNGGGDLHSLPFHDHPRAAPDANNNEPSLGLSNHPLFVPTSRFSKSSDSRSPTPLPYARAPMLFFEQRPDPIPPLNPDYAPQPIVNAPPTSPSVFRRLSATIAVVIPGLAPVRSLSRSGGGGEHKASVLTDFRYNTRICTGEEREERNSNGGGGGEWGRRTRVLTDFRYNTTTSLRANSNLGLDVERTASPPSRTHNAYLPYPPPHYLPRHPSLAGPTTSPPHQISTQAHSLPSQTSSQDSRAISVSP